VRHRHKLAVAVIQLHHLVTFKLPWKLHACLNHDLDLDINQHIRSCPSSFSLFFTPTQQHLHLLPPHLRNQSPYQRTSNPASDLTQSGAFTDDLHTQSPKTIAQDSRHRHPRQTLTNDKTEILPSASRCPLLKKHHTQALVRPQVTKPRNCLSGLSDETITLSRRFQTHTALPEEESHHTQAKMSSPKRRIETDVMKMLMSDYEVTLVNDNMQEFYVRFKGPEESKQAHAVNSITPSSTLTQITTQQHLSSAASGKSTSSSPTSTHTSRPASASSTASSIPTSTSSRVVSVST
jgi:hypothetical protein